MKLDLAHACLYQQVASAGGQIEGNGNHHHPSWPLSCQPLPFGVALSPSLFQRIVETVLQSLPCILIYLDNILVMGKSVDDHIRNLEAMHPLAFGGCRIPTSKQEICAFLLYLIPGTCNPRGRHQWKRSKPYVYKLGKFGEVSFHKMQGLRLRILRV